MASDMNFLKLGSSTLKVSDVCLGTMTWGTQNNQKDADEQIDYALSRGVNFFDTAEMYSVPPNKESYGKTETIIGDWLSRNPERRQDMVLASKIAGPGLPYIRRGGPITGEAIKEAVDGSLKRLQTDYLDLYQLHWPNRTSPHFAKHWPNHVRFSRAQPEEHIAGMLEILQALNECVKAGKIRYCGLSDDTTWGISTYINLSKQYDLPRMVSIQNEFNLLHTKDWPYLIEHCVMEDVAYLPWSPLATGALSGKYLNGQVPEGSRWSMEQRNGLFRNTEKTHQAVAAYKQVADKFGLTATQLALLWCQQVDGVTSTIIGATNLEQLKENIDAFNLEYTKEIDREVREVLKSYAMSF